MQQIATTVQLLIDRTGLSQAQIARLLDLPPKTFNAWLNGSVRCRHQQLLALAIEALEARLRGMKLPCKEGPA